MKLGQIQVGSNISQNHSPYDEKLTQSKIKFYNNPKLVSWIILTDSSYKLELVYLPKGKYCVYPRMVYRLAIVMPPPPPILDDQKSLSIAFLAISDQYATLIFSLTKWLPVAILDDRKSLLIAFLAIYFFRSIRNIFFPQNAYRRLFWMTENHFRSHFSPFQINTQL